MHMSMSMCKCRYVCICISEASVSMNAVHNLLQLYSLYAPQQPIPKASLYGKVMMWQPQARWSQLPIHIHDLTMMTRIMMVKKKIVTVVVLAVCYADGSGVDAVAAVMLLACDGDSSH